MRRASGVGYSNSNNNSSTDNLGPNSSNGGDTSNHSNWSLNPTPVTSGTATPINLSIPSTSGGPIGSGGSGSGSGGIEEIGSSSSIDVNLLHTYELPTTAPAPDTPTRPNIPRFHSHFVPPPSTPSSVFRRMSSAHVRPTKRDLILVLLTISFSYLFLSPKESNQVALLEPEHHGIGSDITGISTPNSEDFTGGMKGATPKKYIPDWLWKSNPASSSSPDGSSPNTLGSPAITCEPGIVREENYQESVVPLGTFGPGSAEINSEAGVEGWDQGNEEFKAADVVSEERLLNMRTELLGHQAGWTLMDRLYIFNGSLYVVT